MDSTEFIIKRIKSVSADFRHVHFRYSYHNQYSTHKILVSSKDVYCNPCYIECELNLYFDFIKYFPNEGLLFISEEDDYIPFGDFTHTIIAGETLQKE